MGSLIRFFDEIDNYTRDSIGRRSLQTGDSLRIQPRFDVSGEPSPEQPTAEKGKDVSGESDEPKKQAAPAKEIGHKYWVAERSIGEFSRAFNFAHHVNPDGVTAELKSGVLSVHVPKASDAVIHTVQVK
ncbi:30 kDa heat shock protein-like protein [Emericellopsis cladophorae]|uniref:30 kDa heat shock protein-like protein n=1 Tax=Emericellopsis cladophorae TaxID=2686198 RepID=A0A9P9XWQ8_9HYPO|nr:30 kDa heat shock protein-like protein [Emericellopsis cladophorae]KAI6778754.1 30 kDa heat shock protein-like protein [Emericellopsis cladophorae]